MVFRGIIGFEDTENYGVVVMSRVVFVSENSLNKVLENTRIVLIEEV